MSKHIDLSEFGASTHDGVESVISLSDGSVVDENKVHDTTAQEDAPQIREASAPAQMCEASAPAMTSAANDAPTTIDVIIDLVTSGDFANPAVIEFFDTHEITKEMIVKIEKAMLTVRSRGEALVTARQLTSQPETTTVHAAAKARQNETRMKEALDANCVDPRSAIGQKFLLAHPKGTPHGDAYHSLNRSAAQEFRVRWVEEKYKAMKRGRVKSETWRHVDITSGKRMPLGKMIQDQGHDQLGVLGCIKTAYKCSLMGAPWAQQHPQTERMEYTLLESSFAETFEGAWRASTEEVNPSIEINKGVAAHSQAPKRAAITEGDAEENPSKRRQTTPTKDKDPKPPATKDEKSTAAMQKKSCALKVQALQVTSSASALLQEIDERDDWSWARNAQNQGKIKAQLDDFRQCLTQFGRSLLAQDMAVLKKRVVPEQWAKELEGFLACKPKLDLLATTVRQMLKRHNL